MMFCKYCHHQTKMIVSDPRYEISGNIKQIRKVSCAECSNFLHDAIKKYSKSTPVNLITGEITQSQLNRLKSERATVENRLNRIFGYWHYWEISFENFNKKTQRTRNHLDNRSKDIWYQNNFDHYIKDQEGKIIRVSLKEFIKPKPQLRSYQVNGEFPLHTHQIQAKKGEFVMVNCTRCEYEMNEDTPTNRNYERFRAWESMYFTDDKGKRHRRSQPKEESEKQTAWCNQLTRGQPTENGELGKLHKHGMEKIQDFVLGVGSKTKVRVCVEGRWEKAGISIRKNGEEVLTQKWIETWRDYVPLDSIPTDTTQDSNLDEIKYCGFSKCPNRYGYITRPEKIKEIFSESHIKEERIKPVRNIWSGEMVTTSYL